MIAIVILVSLALLFVVYSARTRKESESPSRHATPEELAYAAKRLRQGDAKNAVAFQKALAMHYEFSLSEEAQAAAPAAPGPPC